MKKNWKRLLASILCVAMMASILPASAVEEIGEDVTSAVETVAETLEETLGSILSAAEPEETEEVSSPPESDSELAETAEPTQGPEPTDTPEPTEEPTAQPTPAPTEDDGDVELQDAVPDFSGVYIDKDTGMPAGTITLTGASASTTTYTVTFVLNHTIEDYNAFQVADAGGIGTTQQSAAFGSTSSKTGIENVISTGYIQYQWAVASATTLTLDGATPKYIASNSFAFTKAAITTYWGEMGVEGVTVPDEIPVGMVFREGTKYTAKSESVPVKGETTYTVTVRTYLDVPTDKLDTTAKAPQNVTIVSSVELFKSPNTYTPTSSANGVYTFNVPETGNYVIRVNGTNLTGTRARVAITDLAPNGIGNIGFYTVRILANLNGTANSKLLTDSNAKIWNRTVNGNDVPAGTARTAILLPGQYVGISSVDVDGYTLTGRSNSNGIGAVTALAGVDGVYSAQLPANASITGAGDSLTANERPTVTLEFASATRPVTLTIRKDGSAWEGATVSLLRDENDDTSVAAGPSATAADGTVTFNVPINTDGTPITYYVKVNEQTCGAKNFVAVDNSAATAVTKTCNYFSVTIQSENGSLGTVAFGADATSGGAGPYTEIGSAGISGKPTTVTMQAFKGGNNFLGWYRNGSATATSTNETYTTGTLSGSNNGTYVAKFEQATYSATVKVTYNGAAPVTGNPATAIRLLPAGSASTSTTGMKNGSATVANGGVVTFDNLLPDDSYDVYVRNGSNMIPTGMTVSAAGNAVVINRVSAVAETNGDGKVTVTDNTAGGFGSATTASSTAGTTNTVWVLEGSSVSWSTTPDTHFRFDHWDTTNTDTTDPKTISSIGATGETHVGNFVRKTSDVTVNFYKDSVAAGNTYAPGAATVLFDDSDAATTSDPTGSVGASDTSVVVKDVPHGIAHTVKYGGVDTQVGSVTVTDDESTHTVDVIFYGVSLATNNSAKGKVQFTGEGTLAATAGPKYLLPGQTVGVTGQAETDNVFVNWARTSGSAGSLTTDTISADKMTGTNTFTVGKSAATLTATFSKETYTANITVRVDGTALDGATVTLTGKSGVTTDASGKVTVTGLAAGTSYTVTVTKSGEVYSGTYTLKQDEAENDVTLVLDFYSLTVQVGTGSGDAANKVRQTGNASDDVSGSTTSTINYLTTTKLNAANAVTTNKTVTLTATPKSGWRLYSWDNATGSAGTQGAAATATVTVSTDAVTATANFKEMYQVTAKKPTNGSYTASAASPSANYAPASGDDTKWVDVDSYVTVGGVNPSTNYRFDGWEVTGGTLYSDSTLTTAATAAEIKDDTKTLYFKPTATGATVEAKFIGDDFTATVTTLYGGTADSTLVTEVKLVNSTDSSKSYTLTSAASNGVYTNSSVYAGSTEATLPVYDVYVNGYKTTQQIKYGTAADMSEDVTMYEITVAGVADKGTAPAASDYGVQIKTTSGSYGAGPIRVPATAAGTPTVGVQATNNTTASTANHYRFNTAADATAGGNNLWTAKEKGATSENKNSSLTSANVNSATETYSIAGINSDVVITAHLTQQYKVTARMISSQRNTSYVTSMTAGDTTVTGANAANATGAVKLVDVGTRVLVTMATPSASMRLKGWTVESGTLTSAHDAATGGNAVTAASGYYKVASTNNLYVLPGSDLVMEAEAEENLAKVQITVKYGGNLFDAVDDTHGVEIKRSNGTVLANTKNTTARQEVVKASTGTYTFDYLPADDTSATFQVWVNGYNTGETLSVPATGATATAEVTLIKVTPAVTVDGAASTSATGHQAVIKGSSSTSYPNNVSVMYVPASQNDSITYTATAGSDGTISYRMATSTKDGTYSWTWGTALQSDTATGSATVNSADDVVLTAAFISQYQVAVASGASAAGSVAIVNKDASDSTSPVTVDHGDYAKVTATPAGDQIIKDSALTTWTAVNTDTSAAAVGAYGTASAGTGGANTNNPAYYYPVENTTLTANFKNLTATQYKVGTGSATTMTTAGVTINVEAGYTAGAANTATITIGNQGNISTAALQTLTITGTNASAFGTPAASATGAVANGDSITVDVPIVGGLSLDTTGGTLAAKTYTATLNVTDGDLVLAIPVKVVVNLPTSFDAVVETYVDASATPNDAGIDATNTGSVALVSGSTVKTGTHTATGTWSFTGLTWATTYNVYVNGYDTGVQVTNAHVAAGNTDAFEVKNLNTVGWTATSYAGDNDTKANKIYFSTTSAITSTFAAVSIYAADNKTIAVPNGKAVNLSAGNAKTGYRHDGWKATGNTTLTGAPAQTAFSGTSLTMGSTVAASGVRIEPVYLLTFTVRIAPSGLPTGTTAQLRVTGGTAGLATWAASKNMTQGQTADIYVAPPAGYTFSKWTVDGKDLSGTATPYGAFSSATTAGATTAPVVFTPDFATAGLIAPGATITLTPVFLKHATLAIADDEDDTTPSTSAKYDLTDSAKEPVLTYTPNDGSALPTSIQWVKGATADWTSPNTLGTSDYTGTLDNPTLTKTWLQTQGVGTYHFRAVYDLGTDEPGNADGLFTNVVTLTIEVSVKNLTEVNVEVQGKTTNTTAASGDKLTYKDHTDPKILTDDLSWQWYRSNTKPTKGAFNGSTTGWTAIPDGQGAKTDTVTLTDNEKGTYVFAVVTASNTGTGSVITNAFPVDYDADVIVRVNGSAIGDTAKGDYEIVLVHPTTAGKNVTLTGTNFASGKYSTSGSALEGGVTYTVTINRVAGTTTTKVGTGKSVAPTSKSATLDFYTVTTHGFTWSHASDNSTPTAQPVGETETTVGVAKVETTNETAVTVGSGKAVLTGTGLKVTSDTWSQDYTLSWRSNATGTFVDSDKKGTDATSGATAAVLTVLNNVTGETHIGGKLTQNTYQVQGKVVATGGGKVATAKLTLTNGSKTYTFNSNIGASGAGNNDTVTFTVPRTLDKTNGQGALKGPYTLTATGSTNPPTTITGYDVTTPFGTAAEVTDPPELAVSTGGDLYRIYAVASQYTLTLTDSASNTANGRAVWNVGTSKWGLTNGTVTNSEKTGTSGSLALDYSDVTYTFKLTNSSDETLNLTLTAPTAVAGFTLTPPSGVTAGTAITLAPGEETDDFTVKFAAGQPSGTHNYAVNFTSTLSDGTTAGPNMTYNLSVAVKTAAITTVTQGLKTGTAYAPGSVAEMKTVTVDYGAGDVTPETADAADIEYVWVVKTSGTAAPTDAEINAGTVADTYTIAPADAGKYLWLVARAKTGSQRLTGKANSTAAPIGYDATVTLVDKDNSNAPLGDTGYTVVVSPADNATASGAITLTWDATAKCFKTTGGALSPTVATYYVFVNRVEGDTTVLDRKNTITTAKIDADDGVADVTVDYYQVKFDDHATVVNAYAGMDETGIIAGTDATYKLQATVTGVTPWTYVATPKHVVTGTAVSFNESKDWGAQDYKLDWYVNTTADTADQVYTGNGISKTYSASVDTIKAELVQETYTVTAHVKKAGAVTKLTLSDGNNTYTTAASDTGNKVFNAMASGTAYSSITGNAAGNQVQFLKIPKGTYTLVDLGTVIQAGTTTVGSTGYGVPYVAAATQGDSPASITVSADSAFGVYLDGSVYSLTLDDALTGRGSDHTGNALATVDGTITDDVIYSTVVTRDYGWTNTANDTITLTLSNTGNTNLTDIKADLTALAAPNNKAFTVDLGSFAAGATKTLSYTEGAAAETDNTIEIDLHNTDSGAPLPAGDYDLTITFNYKVMGPYLDKSLIYKLRLSVEAAGLGDISFIDVTDSNREIDDTNPNVSVADTLKVGNVEDSNGNVLDHDGLQFTWVSVPHGTAVTVNGLPGLLTAGTAVQIQQGVGTGSGKDTYDAVAATLEGRDIYVLVEADPDAANPVTTSKKLTHVAVVEYTGVITVKADSAPVSADDYTIVLEDNADATKTFTAVWDSTDKVYKASGLTTGNTYSVKAGAIQGTGLAATVDTTKDVSYTAPTAEVDYYSVNITTPTTTNEAYTGTGQVFDTTNPIPALSGTHAGSAYTSGTPVLKGQQVTVKSATWGQDYTLTWQTKTGTGGNSTEPTAWTDGAKQNSTNANGTGTGALTINEKTWVTAKLDQNTYTVTGYIVDDTGDKLSVVTMKANFNGTDITFTTDTSVATYGIGVKSDTGKTVTFQLPSGAYTATAAEAAGGGVTITGMAAPHGNTTTVTGKSVDVTVNKAAADFDILLQESDIKLLVSDDLEDNGKDNFTSNGPGANVTGAVTLMYSYTGSETPHYGASLGTNGTQITLTNPGNTDLIVSVKISEIKGATTTVLYDGTTANLDGAMDGITITGVDPDLTTAGATKRVNNSDATDGSDEWLVATIAVDTGLENVDDVQYKFEFTSVTPTGDAGASATYIYDLTIEPLPVKAGDWEVDGKATRPATAGVGDTLQPKGTDTDNDTVRSNIIMNYKGTDKTALAAGITDATDLSYAWFRSSASNLTKTGFTMDTSNANAYAVTLADGTAPVGTGATYTAVEDDMTKSLYLVIYATNAASNADDFAVVGPIATQFMPMVYVFKDQPTTAADTARVTGENDPGYTLYLAPEDVDAEDVADDGIALSWDKDTNSYRPGTAGNWQSIAPDATYNVWAANAKAADSGNYAYAKVGEFTADDTAAGHDIQRAYYYSVNYNKAVALNHTGGSNLVSSAIKGKYTDGLSAKVGSVALADGEQVLKGQDVVFTMDATAITDGTGVNTWDADASRAHYKMNWSANLTGATNNNVYPDGTDAITHTVSNVSQSVGTAANKVTATLKQELYTVKFKVVDDKGATDTYVESADLTSAETGVTLTRTDDTGRYNGDFIEFTNVPAGEYTMEALPGVGTNVVSYSVKIGDADAVVTTDQANLTDDASVQGDIDGANHIVTITAKSFTLAWYMDKGDGNGYKAATRSDAISLYYGYTNSEVESAKYNLRLLNTGNDAQTEVVVTSGLANNTVAGAVEASAFPVGGGSTLLAKIYDADGNTDDVEYDLKDSNGVTIPAGGYAEILGVQVADVPDPSDPTSKSDAMVGYYGLNLRADSAEMRGADEPVAPETFLARYTITALETVQLPPVLISDTTTDPDNYVDVDEVEVGQTVTAFFVDNKDNPTDLVPGGATNEKVSPTGGEDKAKYQWFYGPEGEDPTVSTANLTPIVDANGDPITTKTLDITSALVDELRDAGDNGKKIYVLAEPVKPEEEAGNGDFIGKSGDDVGYVNPTYTVRVKVKPIVTDVYGGTVTDVNGDEVIDTAACTVGGESVAHNFSVSRGSGQTLTATADGVDAYAPGGYTFDHWEVEGVGEPKVYNGSFGAFKGSDTTSTASPSVDFYPIGDVTVIAVFKKLSTYDVSIEDDNTVKVPEDHDDVKLVDFGTIYMGAAIVNPATAENVTITNLGDAQKVTATVSATAGKGQAADFTIGNAFTPFLAGKDMAKTGDAANGDEVSFTILPNITAATAEGVHEIKIAVTGAQGGTDEYTARYTLVKVKVGVEKVTVPQRDQKPDVEHADPVDPVNTVVTPPDPEAPEVKVVWKDPEGKEMTPEDPFTPGTYTAEVIIKPVPDDFDWSDLTVEEIKEKLKPTFNGTTPDEVVKNDDGTLTLIKKFTIAEPPAPGGGTVGCYPVYYYIGVGGTTNDSTIETVNGGQKPIHVPGVESLDGYKFLGWSLSDPDHFHGDEPDLVDPTKIQIKGATTFYAVYGDGHTVISHTHYVIGYPNGTFGPSDSITRGSVATIIARACLDGFVEGANYGNPGGYTDVEKDWAYSAISFCTMHGVFKGYDDGTFRPGQPITRQELATVVARLAGLKTYNGLPFDDSADIGDWAKDGVYTAYVNGWVNGYNDGTFRPLANIQRDETVKVFNAYLKRGVNAEGLEGLTEYVHTGVASNNTEDGESEYMTWSDVPKGHWAYYEIIEAANDHTFYYKDEEGKKPPEVWKTVKIDERWRYHDNAADGGPQA